MKDGIMLKGRSVMRGWKRGVIPALLGAGKTLKEAQEIALRCGALRHISRVDNLIVTAGKGLVGDLMVDEESAGLAYHAIGTGTTTPSASDTELTTEVERKLWASRDRTGNTVDLSAFYPAAECTYNIKEAGVFGGAAASATPDSGTLFSHYLQSYDNSAGSVDLTFDYSVEIG